MLEVLNTANWFESFPGWRPVDSCQCFHMTEVSCFRAWTVALACGLVMSSSTIWDHYKYCCNWNFNKCVLIEQEHKSYFGAFSKAQSLKYYNLLILYPIMYISRSRYHINENILMKLVEKKDCLCLERFRTNPGWIKRTALGVREHGLRNRLPTAAFVTLANHDFLVFKEAVV